MGSRSLYDGTSDGGQPAKAGSDRLSGNRAVGIFSFTYLHECIEVFSDRVRVGFRVQRFQFLFVQNRGAAKVLLRYGAEDRAYIDKFFLFHPGYYPNDGVLIQVLFWHAVLRLERCPNARVGAIKNPCRPVSNLPLLRFLPWPPAIHLARIAQFSRVLPG